MSFLRRASATATHRAEHADDPTSFLIFKADFSKGEINNLALVAPKGNDDTQGQLNFLEAFFKVTVLDWSLVDDDGDRIKPTVAAYRDLALEAGKWVDEELGAHIERTIGKDIAADEKKPSESPED